jgi:hypothetical protein
VRPGASRWCCEGWLFVASWPDGALGMNLRCEHLWHEGKETGRAQCPFFVHAMSLMSWVRIVLTSGIFIYFEVSKCRS